MIRPSIVQQVACVCLHARMSATRHDLMHSQRQRSVKSSGNFKKSFKVKPASELASLPTRRNLSSFSIENFNSQISLSTVRNVLQDTFDSATH